MFTDLIESQSHRKEFRRRSSFFLITVAAYALILFGAGIASIYAYDANLEAQTSSLELVNWVPPFQFGKMANQLSISMAVSVMCVASIHGRQIRSLSSGPRRRDWVARAYCTSCRNMRSTSPNA